MKGCPYGTHRVIEKKGMLPQPAWKISNDPQIYSNEILIDVKTLNIDSASFTQIKKQAKEENRTIESIILETVEKRGKQHNPVTGSGGMLIGTVSKIGEDLKGKIDLQEGDKIATLVSLSLTPLKIEKILRVKENSDQVDIEGKAVLFQSGIYAKLPTDIDEKLALAVLDVAGAPAQTARLVKPSDIVVVIGAGGKSGLLTIYEAKKRAGVTGKVIGIEYSEEGCKKLQETGYADIVIQGDATNPMEILEKVKEATAEKLADVTINCVNIPDTEMASILVTRDRGILYFFSMATSFTKAALGAEGIGKDIDMLIGNGYAKGHSEIALQIIRESEKIRKIFEEIYV
ncbi:L-erythro-3,5-diaminohexanoate dehydrogenase [Anaerobranca californiensis DSM 14826]|jgi:L-erythro-3,5-diaminohexanoate dehydrogenase|uniref:L-erythro-3,5-diaminohexanoate dehydrogenase n=1 Tax=Anaerobranca californiensis DSM 14826 TaxID=1120989 RepID=A0A1M6M7M6_9FIRM|nr:zinc-binding dehydrogenase [Anaerobranca californiensis]SHJ79380.1 L-erythro-3,5-diaminohexanoate dehydrogenase [Anaerobranca californiensis DSM 14826]